MGTQDAIGGFAALSREGRAVSEIVVIVDLGRGAAGIERAILSAFAEYLNIVFSRTQKSLETNLASLLRAAILAAPEAQSLRGGKLQAELGVADPDTALEKIAAAVGNAVNVRNDGVAIIGDQLRGSLTVEILRDDLGDLQDVMSEVSYTSNRKYHIDWLRWLLTSGDSIVIANYHFWPTGFEASRTGLGIMEQSGVWKVPSEFAGSYQDNWLTRALATTQDSIEAAVIAAVQRSL